MKTIIFVGTLIIAAPTFAFPKFVKSFALVYPGAKTVSCVFCHTPVTNTLNAYGLALQKTIIQGALDPKAVEPLDSDEDSFTNLEEIAAGSLPGDKDSTPGRP